MQANQVEMLCVCVVCRVYVWCVVCGVSCLCMVCGVSCVCMVCGVWCAGILFSTLVFGPACGFILGSICTKFYVDAIFIDSSE